MVTGNLSRDDHPSGLKFPSNNNSLFTIACMRKTGNVASEMFSSHASWEMGRFYAGIIFGKSAFLCYGEYRIIDTLSQLYSGFHYMRQLF